MYPFNYFQNPYEQFFTRQNHQIMHQLMHRQPIYFEIQLPFNHQGLNSTQSSFNYQVPSDTRSLFTNQGLNSTQSSFNYQVPSDTRSPFKHQGRHNTQSSFNYQERSNTRSPFNHQGLNNTQSSFNYQEPSNTRSPFNHQGLNNTQSSFNYQEPSNTRSPFKHQGLNNTQSSFNYQEPSNTRSPFNHQGLNNTQSSLNYQEPSNTRFPFKHQGRHNTQSSFNYQQRRHKRPPFKHQGRHNTQPSFNYQEPSNTPSPFNDQGLNSTQSSSNYQEPSNTRSPFTDQGLNSVQSSINYQERNNKRSPFNDQGLNSVQSSLNYRERSNTRSPFNDQRLNNTLLPFNYQERGDIRSPFKHQGLNNTLLPPNYQEPSNARSPFNYQERRNTRSPSNYREPSNALSPFNYQERRNTRSPSNYREPSNARSPFNYQERRNTRSPSNYQERRNKQSPLISSQLVIHYANIIRKKAAVISLSELTHLLNEVIDEFEKFRDYTTKITNIKDMVNALSCLPRTTLAVTVQHKFFTLLHGPFLQVFHKWNNRTPLTQDESMMFRGMIRLSKPLLSEITDAKFYPAWLSDPELIDATATCFADISKSTRFFEKESEHESNSLLYLLEAFDNYQIDINADDTADPDKLVKLLPPIVQCLTSQFYLDSFNNVETIKGSMSKKDKFFLIKCPTFLSNYNGIRLEETMGGLLSTMLPKYITILNKLVPQADTWNRQTTRAVTQMFKVVDHGSTNEKFVKDYLPFIDHVINILEVPKFYNDPHKTLSNRGTNLVNTAVSLLVNMIGEPIIVSHIKEKHGAMSFLRLTSAEYEPLVDNVYTLLAYTTTEEDIKSMHNPGLLLSTVTKALQTTVSQNPDNTNKIMHLLETLKGLVQHDQIKEEILKQDSLSFLVECSNKVAPATLPLLFEILWSTSFSQDVAKALRSNSQLLEKIQAVSKNTGDEALKKATDGLIWKLIKEPEMLEKVAKREQEEGGPDEEGSGETVVIIGEDGQEIVVSKKQRNSIVNFERVFPYDMMISYCHADKDLIIKLHQFLLDEGFKIWIDLNNMFGPAMSAMAEAVESSEFVLLCMSDSYKQSTYCQAEAEYAFNCKRRLVPLIVRPNYKADGWLGFMIGSRIYVDFGRFDFPTACDKLMSEISRQRKRPLPSKAAQPAIVEQPVEVAPPEEKPVEQPKKSTNNLPDIYMNRQVNRHFRDKYIDFWTPSDVLDFLFTHNLNELMPLCEKMDGPALVQLHKMCGSSYNRTYNVLNDQLKATHDTILLIGTYTQFLSVMEKLLTSTSLQITLAPLALPPPPPPPPPPPRRQPPMLMPPSQPPLILMPPPPPPPPVQYFNTAYDILITSNASLPEVLKMVERMGPRPRLKNSSKF